MVPTEMNVRRKVEADLAVTPIALTRAYITFLAENRDYWMGVVSLTKGLRMVKSTYLLVVAILFDVRKEHRQILVAQGCIVCEIKPVYPPKTKLVMPWLITSSTIPSFVFGRCNLTIHLYIRIFTV